MKAALSVTHVVAGLRPQDGGPAYSVPSLAQSLSRVGVKVVVRCVDAPHAHQFEGLDLKCHHVQSGIINKRMRVSSDLALALRDDSVAGAILHTHGLWLMPNIYPGWIKQQFPNATKIVHSTRGMLSPAALEISRWRKKAVWLAAQRATIAVADCIHATAESEYEEIRRSGLKQPVAVIPNGIDLPADFPTSTDNPAEFTVLSLGRVHPKKGLDVLIRAWASVEREFPNWRLIISGPSELRHDEELRTLADTLQVTNVSIAGASYGLEKITLLRRADLFALPTRNENFGMTVAESLAVGTPVISTKGAPWSGLVTERCGWWIDHGLGPLTAALRSAMKLSRYERGEMGQRGRAWMARDFGWDQIAVEMLDVYKWLHRGGIPPRSIRFD